MKWIEIILVSSYFYARNIKDTDLCVFLISSEYNGYVLLQLQFLLVQFVSAILIYFSYFLGIHFFLLEQRGINP